MEETVDEEEMRASPKERISLCIHELLFKKPVPEVDGNCRIPSHIRSDRPLSVQNAAQFFEHKEIEIIDIHRKETTAKTENSNKDAKSNLHAHSALGNRLILGHLNGDHPQPVGHKIHVKKTWSPVRQPSNPVWEDGDNIPNTDPELKKAYFQQVQEIKALKEQLALKDKRIRQLEDEMNTLRKAPHGESEC